jgi:hypothetical protein
MKEGQGGYGVVAEFGDPEGLLRAVNACRDAGYRDLEAYAPYAIEGLADALGRRRKVIPALGLLGGAMVAGTVYWLQWYSAVIDYPINSGGRPLDSWPAFVPPSADLGVLGSAVAMLAGLLVLCGLPRLHHPLFDVPGFERATLDRCFLVVRATDPRFDADRVAALLQQRDAITVSAA